MLLMLSVLLQIFPHAGLYVAPSSGQPRLVLAFGDSKSMAGAGGGYCRPIQDLTRFWTTYALTCDRLAKGGYTTALWRADIDADLAGISETGYTDVLVNLGANDVVALPAEATWKADMGYVLDALHAKWPTARVFVARVWRTAEVADCDSLDGWVADLVTARSSWAHLGIDERDWLPANSTDGIHPNGQGYVVTAQQWKTVLGY